MTHSLQHQWCLALAAETLPAWSVMLPDVFEIAPDMFTACDTCDAPQTPTETAQAIARSAFTFRDAAALDNWSAIYSRRDSYARNADTFSRTHGDVNDVRARVDTLKREYDETPRVVGRAVDPFDGARHTVTRRRSRKGNTYGVVRRRGRATITGRVDRDVFGRGDWDDTRATMARVLLEMVERMVIGLPAIAVRQITQTCYGDLLDQTETALERFDSLIGTDDEVWSQVFDPCDELAPIAAFNTFTSGPFERSGRVFETDENGVERVVWQAHATCSNTDETRRSNTARLRIARVRARVAERAMVEPITLPDGSTLTRLIGPADSPVRVFIGHRTVARVDRSNRSRGRVRNGARDERRSSARRSRDAGLPVVEISTVQGWTTLADDVAPGAPTLSVRTENGYRVNVSRSARGLKFNVSVSRHGETVLKVQARTASVVGRRIHAATT